MSEERIKFDPYDKDVKDILYEYYSQSYCFGDLIYHIRITQKILLNIALKFIEGVWVYIRPKKRLVQTKPEFVEKKKAEFRFPGRPPLIIPALSAMMSSREQQLPESRPSSQAALVPIVANGGAMINPSPYDSTRFQKLFVPEEISPIDFVGIQRKRRNDSVNRKQSTPAFGDVIFPRSEPIMNVNSLHHKALTPPILKKLGKGHELLPMKKASLRMVPSSTTAWIPPSTIPPAESVLLLNNKEKYHSIKGVLPNKAKAWVPPTKEILSQASPPPLVTAPTTTTVTPTLLGVKFDYKPTLKDVLKLQEDILLRKNMLLLSSTKSKQTVAECIKEERLICSKKLDLSEKKLRKIKEVMARPPDTLISKSSAAVVLVKDLHTLYGSNWLNDEVINFYFGLIQQRSEQAETRIPKVYVFNTFFFPRLYDNGYSSVRTWTRKVDVFSKDLLLIPVHHLNHWTLITVDFSYKKVIHYDSLDNPSSEFLQCIMKYLKLEHEDKKKQDLHDYNQWVLSTPLDAPKQHNGYDCGVFTLLNSLPGGIPSISARAA